jgi:deoxyribodipyrimidine photo-lyase
MKKGYFQTTLFIFRRDLRLQDNTGLIYALKHSKQVIPCFIFTPEQVGRNPYRSVHSLQFMIESLEDLEEELKKRGAKLYLFYGRPQTIIRQCIEKLSIDAVFANRDYTPYSQKRDRLLEAECKKGGVAFKLFDDALLHIPEETCKKNHEPYLIFSPYYSHASHLKVEKPKPNRIDRYFKGAIPFSRSSILFAEILPERSVTQAVRGGRRAANKTLQTLYRFSNYAEERDFPALHRTTHLSAYLKFTILSPREVYFAIVKAFSKQHPLIRALYWRDFFSSIALFFPHVFKGAFYEKFNRIKWNYDRSAFKKWCRGETGFPIVDAGMKEMNETGVMHNRVRMITASFLIKDLLIDWRWGERYFAQNLVDYDPAVNNGNWQWSASTGCDAQPYFRIFNPWTQQRKFDPDCAYIKQWIPSLRELEPKVIHRWFDEKTHSLCPKYPPPMVDHEQQVKKALKAYRAVV